MGCPGYWGPLSVTARLTFCRMTSGGSVRKMTPFSEEPVLDILGDPSSPGTLMGSPWKV